MLGNGETIMKSFLIKSSLAKSLVALAILTATATTGAVLWSSDAFCSSCSGSQCYSDVECGLGCRCAKGGGMYGNCAPK